MSGGARTAAGGICALALVACAATSSTREAPARPNVLFILVDDLGWSDIGCFGNPAVETPQLDAFCAEALKFTDAYAAAPVCSPTRASIMTGHAPARLGITNHMPDRPSFTPKDPVLASAFCADRLPLEYDTLAERLGAAGYATAFMGKWHLSPARQPDEEAYFPDQQGFDLNIGGNSQGGPGRSFFAPYSFPNLESKEEGEYLPYRIGDEAVRYIEGRADQDEPFFLALWHYTVHWPMDAPADLLAKYEARGTGPGIEDVRYAAMTEALDQVFGRVMDALERSGLAEDTLVVFTSDNGALDSVADNRPLRAAKGYLYEGGVRVPTMVRWPAAVEPGETDLPVISTDWYATILAAAGVRVPGDDPGDSVNLLPHLRGLAMERGPLFFHYPNYAWHRSNRLGSAVRDGDLKLIERFDDGSLELFDLSRDLGETTNLAEAQPEVAEALRAKLAAWRDAVDARMPERVR